MSRTNRLVRLEEVATFLGGSTPSRVHPEYFGGDIPWVKTTDLNNGLIASTEETLTPLGLTKSSCNMVPAGAVLVAMYGGFNQIGRTGILLRDCAINQALTAIIPSPEKLNPAFLLEWLNFRVDYWKRFAGSSRKDPNITKGDVADFPVPVIPLDQQHSSAHVLSHWTTAIEKTEKLIEAKEKRYLALASKLLGKRYRTASLKTCVRLVAREAAKPDEPYWALGIRSHGKGTFRRFVDNPNTVSMDTLYRVRRDDLIVNITFAWEGAIAFVDKADEDCFVSHRFPTFEIDRNHALPEYLRHVIVQKRFIRNLGLISPGGAGRNRVLNKKDFLNLKIALPAINGQEQIGNVLNTSLREISLLQTERDLLKKQKRGLMQKLLTGKWRVKITGEVT